MLLTCDSLPAIDWVPLPSLAPASQRQQVAVCRVSVAENHPHLPRLHQLLTAVEQQRARRYHDETDYYRFVVRRAAVRLLLGACLGQAPADVLLAAGPTGKPVLADAPHLHFNVSHAGNWVLIAIASVEVGLDIEKISTDFPYQQLLGYGFSPAEQLFIRQHAAPIVAFHQLWTRKEAFVKATAQGIDTDFGHIPALDGQHQWAAIHPSWLTQWHVSSFASAPAYAAALAYPASVAASQVQFYDVGSLVLWSR